MHRGTNNRENKLYQLTVKETDAELEQQYFCLELKNTQNHRNNNQRFELGVFFFSSGTKS